MEKEIEKPTQEDQAQADENQETAEEQNQEQQFQQEPGCEMFKITNQSKGWEIHLQSSVFNTDQLAGIWLNIMNKFPKEFDKFFSNGDKSNNLSK